jgi:hypothetical protein
MYVLFVSLGVVLTLAICGAKEHPELDIEKEESTESKANVTKDFMFRVTTDCHFFAPAFLAFGGIVVLAEIYVLNVIR